MKRKLSAWSRRYEAALRKHLQAGSRGSLLPALSLGRRAVVLGLKRLELASLHEQALATLKLSRGRKKLIERAEIFFAETLSPIVRAQRASRRGRMDQNRLNDTVGTNLQLKRGLGRCKSVEAALRSSRKCCTTLLKESLHMQESLRQLTRRDLLAQEMDRLAISRKLQDEICQTLLGINVRLLSLKTAARGGTRNLTKEIASARRLVAESIRSINRFANELDIHHPA